MHNRSYIIHVKLSSETHTHTHTHTVCPWLEQWMTSCSSIT